MKKAVLKTTRFACNCKLPKSIEYLTINDKIDIENATELKIKELRFIPLYSGIYNLENFEDTELIVISSPEIYGGFDTQIVLPQRCHHVILEENDITITNINDIEIEKLERP